jgi:outer membrane protein TolC
MKRFFLLLGAAAAAYGQAPSPLPLSLQRAVDLALAPEGNARVQIAGEAVRQARSRSAQARAALLPDLSAGVTQQSTKRNLEALGIRFNTPLPGFQFPTVVGPFNIFDARAAATQTVFDFSSIRRFQASRLGVRAAGSERTAIEDVVSAQVARAYLAALRAQAHVDTVRANIDLAQAVLKVAENQKRAGTGTGLEITRASVQLANERQRLLVADHEQRRARRELLRAIGLRLDTAIELTDRLEQPPVDPAILEQAGEEALRLRADMRAQQEREANARLSASATAMERLPSLAAFADYGSIGSGIGNAVPTRTYGLSLRVPVFDGGRRDARRAESRSVYRQEQARTADLRQQVELEVRLALDSLRSARDQIEVAEEGLGLAENELAQARRRYEAGVANSLEVTDAQTRLARARDNRIAALFQYNLARIDLGQATGAIRRMIQ